LSHATITNDGKTHKQVFLTHENLQLSAQIDKQHNAAYFAIEDTAVKNKGHEVAIGVRNGKAFIQVCSDGNIKIADLFDLISKAS